MTGKTKRFRLIIFHKIFVIPRKLPPTDLYCNKIQMYNLLAGYSANVNRLRAGELARVNPNVQAQSVSKSVGRAHFGTFLHDDVPLGCSKPLDCEMGSH